MWRGLNSDAHTSFMSESSRVDAIRRESDEEITGAGIARKALHQVSRRSSSKTKPVRMDLGGGGRAVAGVQKRDRRA